MAVFAAGRWSEPELEPKMNAVRAHLVLYADWVPILAGRTRELHRLRGVAMTDVELGLHLDPRSTGVS